MPETEIPEPVDDTEDADDGLLTEADVGTTLDCGCEVTRTNVACGTEYDDDTGFSWGHDYPDTGCGDCRFGVPAVYHDEDACTLFNPPAAEGGEQHA